MQYIKRYLKTLTDDISVKKSSHENSISEYWTLNKNFKIRFSDHLCPLANHSTCDIDITTVFDKTDSFVVVVKKSLYPVLLNRKAVKELVKNTFFVHRLQTTYIQTESKEEQQTKEKQQQIQTTSVDLTNQSQSDNFTKLRKTYTLPNIDEITILLSDISTSHMFNKGEIFSKDNIEVFKNICPEIDTCTKKQFHKFNIYLQTFSPKLNKLYIAMTCLIVANRQYRIFSENSVKEVTFNEFLTNGAIDSINSIVESKYKPRISKIYKSAK